MRTSIEERHERAAKKALEKIGNYKSVNRFVSKYAKASTRSAALFHLGRYLAWLRSKGVGLSPDELPVDNLRCVFESSPVDVARKRKHLDWLDEFVNAVLKEKGIVDSSRAMSSRFRQVYSIAGSACGLSRTA